MSMQIEIKGNQIFAPLLNSWLKNTPEEKLKQEFICRLLNVYGYQLEQLGQDIEIKKRYKADIAIWRSKNDKSKNSIPSIIITVECKAEHIKIRETDYAIGYNFASSVNANFFIAHNLKETKIFHVRKDESPQKLEKLKDIPKADILSDDKQIEKYIKETKAFTRDEFSKLLTRCHNIIRNNDKLSPEAAFDEISKVLFMKIMYERKSKEEMVFSVERFKSDEKNYEKTIRPSLKSHAFLDQDYMQILFSNTKQEFENDEIFDPRDQIKIKRNSFEMIVEELETFNLSDTSDDVKGIAFEQFLGKTFRGELGQFFTPRTIVDYMVELLDPREGELICDPCCGSGGFLITAFEHVRNKIDEDVKNEKQKIRDQFYLKDFDTLSPQKQKEVDKAVQDRLNKLNKEFDIKNPEGRYYNLSHNCIFGTDANPRMARTAKMNMIMHGDGHGGVHHHDGLLNVNGIFDGRFDIILTNPPFGARIEKTLRVSTADLPTDLQVKKYVLRYGSEYEEKVVKPLKEWAAFQNKDSKVKGRPILDLFEVGKLSGLTEVLFLERCLNLLKPGGRMGIVLPEGVMNNTALQRIREFVEGRAKIINITSIPQDVFIASGATIKPSLLFLQKFSEIESQEYKKLQSKIIANQNTNELTTKEIENKTKSELKEKFNYQLTIADIKNAGITTTGAYSEDNQLPKALAEFKKYNKFSAKSTAFNNDFVKILSYSELVNWSVSNLYNNFSSKQKKYPSVRIGDFLVRNNEIVKIEDGVYYKRITIKINNNGIYLRDTQIGSKIGTKRQYIVKGGQFALSKIDARSGAMGIIPSDLEGAVVTADFLTYNINSEIIVPEYLELLTSTKEFIEFCKKSSSGTTNRQRLNEKMFLNASIPLPPIKVQRELVKEIVMLKRTIEDSEKRLVDARKNFENLIF